MDTLQLFSDYMKITGTPSLADTRGPDPALAGKRLGVVNAGSWINLWSSYFGQKMLPGVKILNAGNEAVQLNFMTAYHNGEACPPQINIDLFCQYAEQLYRLYQVDAVLISCSTMNRAYQQVSEHMKKFKVPVIQIDQAMMELAVNSNGKILIVATHGPTVKSTQDLLMETAARLGKQVDFAGATVENAFELLGEGNIEAHNQVIARAIREAMSKEKIDIVVLAQMSMSVFTLSYPDAEAAFGVRVLNSGETGFARAGEVLKSV